VPQRVEEVTPEPLKEPAAPTKQPSRAKRPAKAQKETEERVLQPGAAHAQKKPKAPARKKTPRAPRKKPEQGG